MKKIALFAIAIIILSSCHKEDNTSRCWHCTISQSTEPYGIVGDWQHTKDTCGLNAWQIGWYAAKNSWTETTVDPISGISQTITQTVDCK